LSNNLSFVVANILVQFLANLFSLLQIIVFDFILSFTMDKLGKYRNYIKQVLIEYHEWVSGSANLDRESCLVFDEIHDHYFWLFMGWEGKKKIRNIQVHIRMKNEKIYIEEDWTEAGIANELLREHVPKEDIVLAFYDLESRKLTEFAVA